MRYFTLLAACGLIGFAGNACAQSLTTGIYASTGTVASANSNCAAVGIAAGGSNNSVLKYPGAGAAGLEIWNPAGGVLQQCLNFKAVPAGGLNGFTSASKCAIYSINGNVPAATVTFSFTSTPTSTNSAVGTTTLTIASNAPVGAGCVATIDTAIVRSGV